MYLMKCPVNVRINANFTEMFFPIIDGGQASRHICTLIALEVVATWTQQQSALAGWALINPTHLHSFALVTVGFIIVLFALVIQFA